jgi:hypothetical protein
MEEHVIKHTKKAYSIWNDKDHSIWHKLKEFLIEIVIIVFAVTLSIWFHSWSEHHQEQKQVETFLLGLKKDLTADGQETRNILDHYKWSDSLFTYLSSLSRDKKPDLDSLGSMIPGIYNTTFLRPRLSRFNGFLSAGKILTIEDDSLALQILNYYQETIPILQTSEAAWLSMQNNLTLYLIDKFKDESPESYWEVLITPKARFLTKNLISWQQFRDRYNNVITDGQSIITRIDKRYPNEHQ